MPIVYLALGSNISPRRKTINTAIEYLQQIYPKQLTQSKFYETVPFEGMDQNNYFNTCIRFFTEDPPLQILVATQQIEERLGRKRSEGKKWESRTIDIDILLYGEKITQLPHLKIPHYDLCNRDFFLTPLVEIDPYLINFMTGKTYQEELNVIPQKARTVLKSLT